MRNDEEKSFNPTQKKLAHARKKGHAPKTQELSNSALLLIAVLILYLFSITLTTALKNLFITSLSGQGSLSFKNFLWPILAFFLLMVASGLFFAFFPRGFVFRPLRLKWPKKEMWSHLYPLTYSFLKIIIIVLMVGIFIIFKPFHLNDLPFLTFQERFHLLFKSAFNLALAISSGLFVLSIGDYIYQKWRFKQEMRMTAKEMKEEKKETEGSFQTKEEIKRRMRKDK